MRKVTLLPLAAMALLAACDGAEINQPPVQYTPTKALNEVGTTSFTARSYLNAHGKRNEITGVSCRFEGAGFYANFVTPAVVSAPNMQLRTPPASVTCTYNGVSKTQVLRPYNKTTSDINNKVDGSAGIIGLIATGIMASVESSSRDATLDIWAYPNAAVEFTE